MGFFKQKVGTHGVNCSSDKILTEQSHKAEVDINNIIRRHGIDIIAQTAALNAPNMRFDDATGNDFQEAMLIVARAQESFDNLPSGIRKRFSNNAAAFLDFVQDEKNKDELVKMGLANPPIPPPPAPEPILVQVVTPVTPPA